MKKLRMVQVATGDLLAGMFVAELELPWSESPFLIEGFRIGSHDELIRLRELCSYVIVDIERSNPEFEPYLALRLPVSDDEEDPPPPLTRPLSASVVTDNSAAAGRRAALPPRPSADEDGSGHDPAGASGPPLIVGGSSTLAGSDALLHAHRVHDDVRGLLSEFLEDLRLHRKPQLDEVERAVGLMAESISENPEPLVWLTYLKRVDPYIYRHGIDCSVHLMSFARHLGYPRQTMETVGIAGLLLDVGKIRVADHLRRHEGRYNKAEMSAMRHHVMHSVDILHQIPRIDRKVLETVAQHHERMDGSGYPVGLDGSEIEPLACMAMIADAYTAMISERVHAPARSIHDALQTLEHWKGYQFHPGLVEQFTQCVGIYPVGAIVELNSKEVGVVIAQNRVRRLKPTVMIVLDAQHQPYPFPAIIDLIQDTVAPGGEPYRILRDLPLDSHGVDLAALYLKPQ